MYHSFDYIITLTKNQPNNSDVAIIDEIAGVVPERMSDAIEQAQHKRMGYTFPASKELYELLSSG